METKRFQGVILDQPNIRDFSISRDGKDLAWFRSGGTWVNVSNLWAGWADGGVRHPGNLEAVVISPDGKKFVAVSGDADLPILVCYLGRGLPSNNARRFRIEKWPDPSPTDVAVSPDSELAVIGGTVGFALWDFSSGELMWGHGVTDGVYNVEFSADGETLGTACRNAVQLWDIGTRTMRFSLDVAESAALVFHPEMPVVFTGDYQGRIAIWDCASGELLQQHKPHDRPIDSIAVSPDGKTLASCDAESINIWEIQLAPELAMTSARPRQTPIDFQDDANISLDKLGGIPSGVQRLGDVDFQIGPRVMQLGSRVYSQYPTETPGILVARKVKKLHFLHATLGGADQQTGDSTHERDGAAVGYYVIYYVDRSREAVPLVYGHDLRDWRNGDDMKPVSRGHVAWSGKSADASRDDVLLRLYVSTWRNPSPDKPVARINFHSSSARAAPFCAAITSE